MHPLVLARHVRGDVENLVLLLLKVPVVQVDLLAQVLLRRQRHRHLLLAPLELPLERLDAERGPPEQLLRRQLATLPSICGGTGKERAA